MLDCKLTSVLRLLGLSWLFILARASSGIGGWSGTIRVFIMTNRIMCISGWREAWLVGGCGESSRRKRIYVPCVPLLALLGPRREDSVFFVWSGILVSTRLGIFTRWWGGFRSKQGWIYAVNMLVKVFGIISSVLGFSISTVSLDGKKQWIVGKFSGLGLGLALCNLGSAGVVDACKQRVGVRCAASRLCWRTRRCHIEPWCACWLRTRWMVERLEFSARVGRGRVKVRAEKTRAMYVCAYVCMYLFFARGTYITANPRRIHTTPGPPHRYGPVLPHYSPEILRQWPI